MAANDKSTLIGHDPLAWMEHDSGTEQRADSPEAEQTSLAEPVNSNQSIKNEVIDPDSNESTKAEVKPEINSAAEIVQPHSSEETEDVIRLDSISNIQNVSQLHDRLIKQFDQKNAIEIDASDVVSIDASTLQLLIVLKQSAIKNGKEMVIDFPSENFIEAASLLGLSDLLEVEQSAAGFF